jgi:hypothetical protein
MASDEHWKKHIQCVLRAIGAFEPPIVEEVAAALYKRFMYEDQQLKITLLAIGSRINQEYLTERPEVRQLLFRDMIQFIYRRFRDLRVQKRDHKQIEQRWRLTIRDDRSEREIDFVEAFSDRPV